MSERKIDDNDYNQLRDKILEVLGNGYGNRGYGQTIKSQRAVEGSTITSNQWNEVSEDLSNALVHQTGVFPNTNEFDNEKLITLADYNQLSQLADTLLTNRFQVGTGRTIASIEASSSATQEWTVRAQSELTVTFNTSNEARYFFNSSGKIRLISSRVGGSTSPQNSAWSNLLNAVGNLDFEAQSIPEKVGYYGLTNSYQIFYQRNLSTPYSSNYYRVEVKSDVSSNTTGSAKILYFKITWEDLFSGPQDKVDGKLQLDVVQVKATGPLKDNTNFNIISPTYILSDISLFGVPQKTYSLSVDKFSASAINDTFTVTLNTFNVPDGEVVPYTITGVLSSDIDSFPLKGTFTVRNNRAVEIFKTTSRDSVPVIVQVPTPVPVSPPPPTPLPTPIPLPSGSVTFTSPIDTYSYWTVPDRVTSLKITVIGPGGNGGTSSRQEPQMAGGGGGGGAQIVAYTVCTPGQSVAVRPGKNLASSVGYGGLSLIAGKGADGGNATNSAAGLGGAGGVATVSGSNLRTRALYNGADGAAGIKVANNTDAGFGKGTAKGGDGGKAGGFGSAGAGGAGGRGNSNGGNGSSFGGGGGGAGVAQKSGDRSNPAYYGGQGTQGYILIEWGPGI